MPQGCQEAAPTPSRILCSRPTLAREVLTCSSGPGAALTYSLVPEASNPGPDVGLEDLGAFAVAIQAKAQMRLRCLGKGLHLQEGRGQTFVPSDSTGLFLLIRAQVLPLLVMGIQYEEWLSLPGCPEHKVLFLWKSGFQDPTGCIPGRGWGCGSA